MTTPPIQFHVEYFNNVILPLFCVKYKFEPIWNDFYKISNGDKSIHYNLDTAILQIKNYSYPCGVDSLILTMQKHLG